jgi:hypothetical protein
MKAFCGITFCLLTHLCSAQQFVDVAKLSYRFSPNNELMDDLPSEVDISDLELNVFLPFEQEDNSYVFVGGNYTSTRIGSVPFSSFSLLGGYSGMISRGEPESWEYLTLLIPKVSNDGGKIISKDVQIGVYSLFRKKKNESFKWRLGSYMNTDRFGFLLVPLFGFEWQVKENLKVDMTLPVSATIRKTFNRRLMGGLNYVGRKYSYNISATNEYLEVADNTVNLFADIYLTERIVLNLQAGHSVLRSYDIYGDGENVIISFGPVDLDDDRRAPRNEISQGAIFKGGLFYRFSAD